MKRAICLSMLVSLLGCAGPAWAAPPERGAPLASGVSFVHFNLSVASTLPAGSIILCKGELVPAANRFNGAASRSRLAPLASTTGRTVLRGSTAECALEIPFSWTGNGGQSDLAVRYEIDAIARPGAQPVVLQRGVEPAVRLAPSPTAGVVRLGFNSVR
jgi:hypothetical protein